MSGETSQVRHTVSSSSGYQCSPPPSLPPPASPTVRRCPLLALSSPGSTRATAFHGLSYENSSRLCSTLAPISSSSSCAFGSRRNDDDVVLLVLAATSIPSPPTLRSPCGRLTAGTCIVDSSELLSLIALLRDIVEFRVTVFTSDRPSGCLELFKSFSSTALRYAYTYSIPSSRHPLHLAVRSSRRIDSDFDPSYKIAPLKGCREGSQRRAARGISSPPPRLCLCLWRLPLFSRASFLLLRHGAFVLSPGLFFCTARRRN